MAKSCKERVYEILEATDPDWEDELCPACIEEFGMMNLTGFDEDL